jgi:putative salt-induced outer membrane protein YdiY
MGFLASIQRIALALAVSLCGAAPALAQAPAAPAAPAAAPGQPEPPPPTWTGTISGGLALTDGNSDTSNINLAYEIIRDPKTRNLFRSDALYLRGASEGDLTVDRTAFTIRDEYKLTTRLFVFGQFAHLRDEFKAIDYLIAPTAGVGYKLYETKSTLLSVDTGFGPVWEKNPGRDVDVSGAWTLGEKLSQKISETATITQSANALFKTDDFDDSLYTFGLGLAASMTTKTQLKIELLDTYKNLPVFPATQKNDIAIIMAIVYKIG